MTLNWFFTLAIAICALLYFAALAYAAYLSRVKREIYILKALLVAYFVVLAAIVLMPPVSRTLWALFRPSLAALFLLLFMSKVIDIKRRG